MRAVNLIPADERRNAAGVGGRSDGAAYLLLAVLAALVVVVAVHTMLSKRVGEADAQAASLTAQAEAAEARAASREEVVPTASYATLRAKRVKAVTELVESRVDWPAKLRQLAQALPTDITLQQLTASASAGATSSSGGSSLRGALDVPAFELTGCARDQDEVASTLTDLQSLAGVTRVSLASSEAADEAASSGGAAAAPDTSGGGSSASADGCGSRPAFSAVVFFSPPAGVTSAAPTTSTTP